MVCPADVLIVDDQDDIREMLEEILGGLGYRVRSAADGRAALGALEEQRPVGLPCVILLDLMMPVMNGWQFIEEVRRDPSDARSKVPIVVTTAAPDVSDPALTMVQAVLRKPIDLQRLVGCIAEHCPAPGHS